MKQSAVDDTPKAKFFREKIGDKEYELQEEKLDVLDELRLWDGNPRLLPYLAEASGIQSEEDLENHLKRTNGYGPLAKSIADIGQMEPVYAWKREEQPSALRAAANRRTRGQRASSVTAAGLRSRETRPMSPSSGGEGFWESSTCLATGA